MATIAKTRAAKDVFEKDLFQKNPGCNGCAVTKEDLGNRDKQDDYCIVVMFETEEARDDALLPDYYDGVKVQTKVVGKIVAQFGE